MCGHNEIYVENSACIYFLMGARISSVPKEEKSMTIIAFWVSASHIEHYEMSMK